MTPSPRVEWRRVLAFVTLTVLVVAIAILTKERMVVALLLKASEEIPEGSSVVHIIERSHVDC
jgi:lipoprotein signal peptidase